MTASDENLKWALGLEADRMVNVKFTKEILDTEMTVVRNEFERGENSPRRSSASASRRPRISGTTTASRPLARRTTSRRCRTTGWPDFYHKYYQPDDAVLVVTGRIDEAEDASS